MSDMGIDLLFDASPFQVAADLFGFAGDLDDATVALEKIVKNVAIPSIRENFEVGGRPSWEPLSPGTIAQRGSAQPLMRTGELYSAAQNFRAWDIRNNEATLSASQVTDYAAYHQDGTREMPQRQWAALTPEEEDQAEEMMVSWVAERLGDHDFAVFANSIGDGDF